MERDYEIFEQFPDGTMLWRARVKGLPQVRSHLDELSKRTKNECFATHLSSKEVVARINVGGSQAKVEKRLVCQVAYNPVLARARTDVLRAHGYEVVTVIGNEAAKLVLDLSQSWNFFMVGHGAAKEVREEMVAWLKQRFPGVPILALNPPGMQELPGADYNVKQNGPELWLPLVANALGRPSA